MPLEDLELFILNDGYTDMLSFCETSLCRCHWGLNDLHILSDVCRRSKNIYIYIYLLVSTHLKSIIYSQIGSSCPG